MVTHALPFMAEPTIILVGVIALVVGVGRCVAMDASPILSLIFGSVPPIALLRVLVTLLPWLLLLPFAS